MTGKRRDPEDAKNYISKLYEQQAINRDRREERKTLYPHFTCATDTNNIRRVFSDVKDTVLLKSLRDYGVIWTVIGWVKDLMKAEILLIFFLAFLKPEQSECHQSPVLRSSCRMKGQFVHFSPSVQSLTCSALLFLLRYKTWWHRGIFRIIQLLITEWDPLIILISFRSLFPLFFFFFSLKRWRSVWVMQWLNWSIIEAGAEMLWSAMLPLTE